MNPRLDDALKKIEYIDNNGITTTTNTAEADKLLASEEISSLLTEKTLNIAILLGDHSYVDAILNRGATPNAHTLLCALFSDLPHYTVTKLLKMNAPKTEAINHIEKSNVVHYVRTEIKGMQVNNLSVTAQSALTYAKANLTELTELYGPFKGLEFRVKSEKADKIALQKTYEIALEKRKNYEKEKKILQFGNNRIETIIRERQNSRLIATPAIVIEKESDNTPKVNSTKNL